MTEHPPIRIVNTAREHCDGLAALQQAAFPTLSPDEYFSAAMYRAHVDVFPDGQFAALALTPDGEQVVGGTTTFRTTRSFDGDTPYYWDVIGHGFLTTHEPRGDWLYGVDISIHPDYRRRGIGTQFYDARRALVRRLNLRGEIVAGLMPGYVHYRDAMTVEAYAARVTAGDLTDPTLTMQLRNGFTLRRLLYQYVHDPRSNDVVTLLVRPNPEYTPL